MAPCRPRRLVCTGTVLLHFITGNLRDLLSVLEYQTLHVTMVRDGSVELFKHVMNISSFRPRVTLARLSPLRCLSGLRRCSHICKALHPPTALPRVALVRTGDLRPQTDRAALSLPDFGDGTHLVAADGALRRAHAPPAGLIGARYGAHRKVRRATGAHALVPTWQE